MNSDTFVLFSDWPDVPINKTETEIEMFTKYFDDIIDKNAIMEQMALIISTKVHKEEKSKSSANNYRVGGNKSYRALDYTDALLLYNNSISRAPRNSNEFGLAIANRSAVLFDINKYQESLEDINAALRSEFPKHLRFKLFLRQSNCYLKLKQNFEAARSLRKATECIEQLNLDKEEKSSIDEKILEIKSELKKQLESNVSEDNNPDDEIVLNEPILKDGENSTFLNATRLVDIKHTEQLGRHVVANSQIKKGDVLFIEKPYSFVPLIRPEIHKNVCAFCLQRSLNCIPCTVCTSYFYCTDDCRQNDWEMSHRWECLGTAPELITNPQHKLCLSILYKASHDGFKITVDDESVYGNSENNYPFVNKLLTNKNSMSDDDLKIYVQVAVWMVLYLKNYTDYFDWLYMQPNRPEGTQEELYKFIGGQLVKYLLQINCNAVVIREGNAYCKPNGNIEYIGVGYGIFTSTALLNHSCVPNAVQSFSESTRIVTALKDIEIDTEITINYLLTHCYFTKVNNRQTKLKKFCFTCSCRACTDPAFDELRRPWLCRRCNGKAYRLQKQLRCSECRTVFNATEYFRNDNIVRSLLRDQDRYVLHEAYNLIKKTYHKNSMKYFLYYDARLRLHGRNGNIRDSVSVARSLAEVAKGVYGDTSQEGVGVSLTYIYFLAKYCISLRMNNMYYENVLEDVKAEINKLTNILHYYICTKNLKIYLEDVTKYLNSPTIDKKVKYKISFLPIYKKHLVEEVFEWSTC